MLGNLIVIDANFILLPFQFKIDYLYEIDASLEGRTIFIVYKQILDELEAKRIREPKARKFHMNFKAGLFYLEKNNEKYNIDYKQNIKLKDETTDNETTDNFLLKSCMELKSISKRVFLATNDAELRRKAKKMEVSTIFLRQKKYLSFD
jgi:rRNA-processing protein FCF1